MLLLKCYLINIFSTKNGVCMCNISIYWKICHLHNGIKMIRSLNLINPILT